jgi:hypothetical protein
MDDLGFKSRQGQFLFLFFKNADTPGLLFCGYQGFFPDVIAARA